MCYVCFFKQKTAYEMRISDWSSDVCSSDLHAQEIAGYAVQTHGFGRAQHGGRRRAAADQRACRQRPEIFRFGEGGPHFREACRNRVDLLALAGEAEQRGCVTPRQACRHAAQIVHAPRSPELEIARRSAEHTSELQSI